MSKVPSDKSGLKELVLDLVKSCTSQGARDPGPMERPLTFTEQVSTLKEKGLISSGSTEPTRTVPSLSPQTQALKQSHRDKVESLEIRKQFIRHTD